MGTIAGQRFRLADGSSLEVQLKRTLFSTDLRVSRNGIPLPGSAGDPATGWKNAYGLMYFIGGLNILIGLLAMFGVAFLLDLGIGAMRAMKANQTSSNFQNIPR